MIAITALISTQITIAICIAILRDEEGHRRLFEGYLREYEAEGLA